MDRYEKLIPDSKEGMIGFDKYGKEYTKWREVFETTKPILDRLIFEEVHCPHCSSTELYPPNSKIIISPHETPREEAEVHCGKCKAWFILIHYIYLDP